MTAVHENTAADWSKLWRINRTSSGHVTPFGTACVLLLGAILLTGDSNVAFVHPLEWRSRSQLQSELERALAVARASMVELPTGTETAAVAQLASKVQMVSLETQQVAAVIRALQANYDELERERETEFIELERSIHRTRNQVLWLQEQQKALEAQTKMAIAERHLVGPLAYSAYHLAEFRDVGDVDASYAVSHPEIRDRKDDETAQSSVMMAAAWIANSLQETREDALLSGEERLFILDLDQKVFKSSSARRSVSLGSDLNLSVFIAKSETIDGTSGGIRFFPDGSSTGGRIDLNRHGERVTIVVEWSTGAVDIQKASADPHLALMQTENLQEPANVR